MAGERRRTVRHHVPDRDGNNKKQGENHDDGTGISADSDTIAFPEPFLRRHTPALLIFFLCLFFIITISNPALYTNDEWITANQLHQLDIGHQLIFSEGKYGVTQNGSVSAYFTYRQNILMYSLALPVCALPAVKLFRLMGDNFRLFVILLWSLCLIFSALLAEYRYPARLRARGIRLSVPAILLALILFMINILLYKQFPFSAPDAPFEVAALVLTNQIFLALTAAVIFETLLLIRKDTWTALFGTFATLASSSFIFWAGTAKDHMLAALVFSLVLYCFIRHLSRKTESFAFFAFVFSGLLVWIRPEVGFFVTVILGLYFGIPRVTGGLRTGGAARQLLAGIAPAGGVFLGAIPFFINNLIISRNWLIPAMDLPRDLSPPGGSITTPLPMSQVITDTAMINQTAGMTPAATLARAWDMVMHAMFGGFTFENMVRGFIGTMTFPENHSIGFIIMCPLVVIGLAALILWWKRVLEGPELTRTILLFLALMIVAVFLSYLTKFGSMNISHGILPDMRYLSPAYIPCGLLAVTALAATPFFTRPKQYIMYSLAGGIIILPLMFFLMVFVHPFGTEYEGYSALFKYTILAELVICTGMMVAARHSRRQPAGMLNLLPCMIILILLTAFSFQFMLSVLYGMIMKMNGYPFWIPIIREGVNLFVVIQYTPPV